jgi:hypothetical protein
MALQVAGMEKINSMDFCRASVYRANFFRITKYQMLGRKTNVINGRQRSLN